MKSKIYIVIFLLGVIPVSAVSQNLKKSNFIGKWMLTKHVVSTDGTENNYPVADHPTTYSFFKNGSFSCSYFSGDNGNHIEGKWRLVSTDKEIKIRLSGLKEIPDNPINVMSDYDLIILKSDRQEFVTEEFLFTEETPGRSTFSKVR